MRQPPSIAGILFPPQKIASFEAIGGAREEKKDGFKKRRFVALMLQVALLCNSKRYFNSEHLQSGQKPELCPANEQEG